MKLAQRASLDRKAYIKARDMFVQKQHQYLVSAAEKGSINAVKKLASLHYNQQIKDPSFIKSFAYNQAILMLTDDNTLYNRYNWYQQKLHNTMAPDDIAQAMSMTEQLIDEINSSGSIYR